MSQYDTRTTATRHAHDTERSLVTARHLPVLMSTSMSSMILAYMAFCEVSQDQSAGTPAAAGDFGWKLITSTDPEVKKTKLNALSKLPVLGGAQIIAFAGLIETTGFFQASSTTDGRGPREGQFSMKDSTENFLGKVEDPEARKSKLAAELANGRLAMMAIAWLLLIQLAGKGLGMQWVTMCY